MIFLHRLTIRPNKLPLLMGRNFIMYEKRVISYLPHRVKADMALKYFAYDANYRNCIFLINVFN